MSLNATGKSFAASGGVGDFAATGNPSNCMRSAVSTVDWITISFGGGTSNPVTFGYEVKPNTSLNQRTGTISVNGGLATYTVSQQGAGCTYTFSPGNASVSGSGGTGTTQLGASQTGCQWTATISDPWIRLTSPASGTGSSTIGYSVDPNSTGATRSGTINVGNASFNITQSPACAFVLSPASMVIPAASNTGTVSITATSNSCSRTATSDSSWLTITSGQSGTGNGTVAWSATTNNSPAARTGIITVADATFTLTQQGASCLYTVNPVSRNFTPVGGSGTISLTTTCSWTATSTADWLVVIPPASGIGNATIGYSVAPSGNVTPRSANIVIGSASFTAVQEGVPCAVTIGGTGVDVPAEGFSSSIEVSGNAGCNWTAASTVTWITILSGATGNGNGTVTYQVAASNTASVRTGAIVIGNQTYTIRQTAAACSISVDPPSISGPAAAFSGRIQVSSNCEWSASSTAAWISITSGASGTGNGQVEISAAANNSAQARNGAVRIGSLTVPVSQAGTSCSMNITPLTASVDGGCNSGRIQVTGSPGCTLQASSNSAWLTITGQSYIETTGSGSVDYAIEANRTFNSRVGVISVGSQTFTVTQAGSKPAISSGGVLNGASFKGGAVAPGEIVSIFGFLLGPEVLATAEVTPDGQHLTDQLAGTRVFFDHQPAPMVFTRFDQLSTVVPYSVAGRQSTKVVVEYKGISSEEVTIPVAATSPAIFAADSSGAGQGAVLNQDFTVNSEANPAARNTVIMIFATGEGVTNPAGVDGKLAVPPAPQPRASVAARIGGQNATIRYSGGAPGLVAGALQVNALIPTTVQPGSRVPVQLIIGGVESPAGITIAVR